MQDDDGKPEAMLGLVLMLSAFLVGIAIGFIFGKVV